MNRRSRKALDPREVSLYSLSEAVCIIAVYDHAKQSWCYGGAAMNVARRSANSLRPGLIRKLIVAKHCDRDSHSGARI
jgi:hypothetical protein